MTQDGPVDERRKALVTRLADIADDKWSYAARVRVPRTSDVGDAPDTLFDILQSKPDRVSIEAREIIESLETAGMHSAEEDWIDFKWKLSAFYEIQDAFDAPLLAVKGSKLNLFHLWYFYFESRSLLTESILCGFQGLYAASNAVLRLFVEFSVFQLYFYSVSHEQRSLERLESYFRDKRSPSWHTALQKAIPGDGFCRPIKARLDFHFKGLSESAAHSYHPSFSPRSHAQNPGRSSFEGVYFWQLTRVVLQSVLWAYSINFPMAFFPKDTLRKFGFNPPAGVFVDDYCATVIRRGLGEEDYERFVAHAATQSKVADLLAWYNGRDDLSDEQVSATWNSAENGELKVSNANGYARMLGKMRVIREMIAMLPAWAAEEAEHPDFDLIKMFSYDRWRQIYRGVRK